MSLRARALGAAVLASAAASLLAPTASAHPFGAPPTATVSRPQAATVRVHWQVGAADDLSYLAAHLDLLPPSRVLLDGAVTPEDGDPAVLEGSPRFDSYVLEHVAVAAGGATCTGTVTDKADILASGVDVDFTCPRPVTRATVTLSMLTDMSPLYSTLATGPSGQKAAYAQDETAHAWSFSGTGGTSSGAWVPLALTAAGLGLAGAGAVVATRARRRRRATPTA
ncbi:hypothetical protein ACFT5B_12045 [Luteimicrobium sp. NPDC057192]|uniref:hypothetical protein n=1 Tax=Luteimicrobium sp. NPDC057192 TaxID=3346042 RepID=UPI00363EC4A5